MTQQREELLYRVVTRRVKLRSQHEGAENPASPRGDAAVNANVYDLWESKLCRDWMILQTP